MRVKNDYVIKIGKVEPLQYLVCIMTHEGLFEEVTVSEEIYQELVTCKRNEESQGRSDRRYLEQMEMSDVELNRRAIHKRGSTEDSFFALLVNEELWKEIDRLPDLQRRRFLLHYDHDLTYQQIAEVEGCTKMAVKASVDVALLKIKNNLKNF